MNVLELAKKIKCRLIFASTSDVYGISKDVPFKEDSNLLIGQSNAKRWAYAVSKIFCEHLCFSYHKDFNLNITILRFFGGFSERSSFNWSGGHIPIFINQIMNNKVVTIHGNGKQTRSMGHASDLAYGLYLTIKSKKVNGQIINIGNNEELSVIDSAYLIADILNKDKKKIKIRFIPENKIYGSYKDLRRRIPDLKKAKKLIGYKPKIKLREAITNCIKELSKK